MISIVMLSALVATVSALTDPYPLDGYIVDKAGNALSGANVTFNNTNTNANAMTSINGLITLRQKMEF